MASMLRRFASRFTAPPAIGGAWEDPELVAALDQVGRGELRVGQQLLAATHADAESRSLRVDKLARLAVDQVEDLALMSKQDPDDPDLALWLGATRINHAWKVRGATTADQVSQEAFEQFWLILGGVAEPLERAARLLPADPTPWDQLMWRGLGLQVDRTELDDLWAELVRRDPFFYTGCYSRAQVLCAKWQGSNEEVLEFANTVADTAPEGHPVTAMPVVAHLEVAVATGQRPSEYYPSIHDRIATLADAFNANPMDHLRTIEAHHLFGAMLYFANDNARAARHLAQVSPNTLPEHWPWVLTRGHNRAYRSIRHELGLD